MANELVIKNGLITPAVTASLEGTASYASQAVSASWAPGGDAFPYTGSATISGSVIIDGKLIHGYLKTQPGNPMMGTPNWLGNTANGEFAHAEGFRTRANGDYSHAEGNQTRADDIASHAEGYNTTASGQYSHAEGQLTAATGQASHAEGSGNLASGQYSHAEGWLTNAIGDYSHAEGWSNQARGESSHAEGYETIAYGGRSHTEGEGTRAVSTAQHAQGRWNLPVSGAGAFILGNGFSDNNRSNLIFAQGTTVQISGSTEISGALYVNGTEISSGGGAAFPFSGSAVITGRLNQGAYNTVSDDYSHAEGFATIASGPYSHAEGYSYTIIRSVAYWEYLNWNGTAYYSSNPFGNSTGSFFANGDVTADFLTVPTTATTFGMNNLTIPGVTPTISAVTYDSGTNKTRIDFSPALQSTYNAINNANTAYGTGSHAEGNGTLASGSFSHAEGQLTIAKGDYSHAEGNSSQAYGQYSHAEGYSQAYGETSHAEGMGQSWGTWAHAEGFLTFAYGNGSHAEGNQTIAVSNYQHVQGEYNLPVSGAGAFIVGNGNSGTRKNLIFAQGTTVQITGSTEISGALYVNGTEISSGGGAAFPYTGSATISGSLALDGAMTYGIANGFNQARQTSLVQAANSASVIIATLANNEDAMFIDYVVKKDANVRAGTIVAAINNADEKTFTETTTTDLGDTSGVTFVANVNGGVLDVSCTTNDNGWNIKTIIRTI